MENNNQDLKRHVDCRNSGIIIQKVLLVTIQLQNTFNNISMNVIKAMRR